MPEEFWVRETSAVKGVSAKRKASLEALGIHTVGELLEHMPREYRDFSVLTPVAMLQPEMEAACVVRCAEPRISFIRKGMNIVSVSARDETGSITLIWYNQPYRKNAIHTGQSYVVMGKVEEKSGALQMTCPALETTDERTPQAPGILPVYPLTAGISQNVMRTMMRSALDAVMPLKDELPFSLRQRLALCERNFALENIHFPLDMQAAQQAKRRISTETLLYFLLALQLLGKARKSGKGRALMADEQMLRRFVQKLPFAPTSAQTRAMEQIAADLRGEAPMSRLLQGDVGSGKTAVALFALFAAMENGVQGVMMAPTEILAQQHARAAAEMFGEDNVCLLMGSLPTVERNKALEHIAGGKAKVIIGTHALLQEKVSYADLGVVVTDEQHRFGVRQRAALTAKGREPHALIMSATPIPRTLALLLFGDLEVTTLDEKPPGRQRIATHVVGAHKREAMYGFVLGEVKAGRQAYVVCPLIEAEDAQETASLQSLFGELSMGVLRDARLKMLHGKMPPKEKEAVIRAFAEGSVDVLLATTVVEVGVDVANATVMVIEGADRFGLAQIHQLRGRVGRGAQASYCFLRYDGDNAQTKARLKLLTQTDDGFEIAQKDLQWRGPGAFLGTRQHGLSEGVLQYISDIDVLYDVQATLRQVAEDPDTEESRVLCVLAQEKYAPLWDTWVSH